MSIARARKVVAARSGGICEICHGQAATEWHHRKNRSQGGTWAPSNGLHVCHSCHRRVTEADAACYAAGWRVRPWEDPATVAVSFPGGWALLDDEGRYVPHPAESL